MRLLSNDPREIERAIREPADKPIELQGLATVDLPNAASYPYGMVYDLTVQSVKFSNGTAWVAIPRTDAANTWSATQLFTSAFGYGTGAGGAVTQTVNKGNSVTLNKLCGEITMNSAALAAGATAIFGFLNNQMANGDTFTIQMVNGSGTGDAYQIWTVAPIGGGTSIYVRNISSGSLSEAIVLRFAVIKGAIS